MAPKISVKEEPSDFEKQRLANIAERDKLLAELQVKKSATQAGLYTKPQKRAATEKPKSTPAKRVKKEVVPRRTSSRIAGIQADSEVAREQEEKQYQAQKEADIEKRKRRTDDLKLGDITVNGQVNGFFGSDVLLRPVARPNERTFTEDEIRETGDKDLKSLREKMSSLEIWDAWEPNRIKITPERIYSASFHPTEEKPIVFMGDKLGHLGIVDASQKPGSAQAGVKHEANGDEDEDDYDDTPDPEITIIKPHTRTICSMYTHPSVPTKLFTGSYDSSIRSIDLEKQIAVEIYGPSDTLEDAPISGIDMSAQDPHSVYFTTLHGAFGQHDTRSAATDTKLYQLSEKKIGGFTLHPLAPHYLATASLDRTMKLWDLRKINKSLPTLVGEHESRLSVSHAAFNTAGQVATSSYDDTIKIHSFGVSHLSSSTSTSSSSSRKLKIKQSSNSSATHNLEAMATWTSGFTLPEDTGVMDPEITISHNNQTGRWVTILRPQWQRHPTDGIQKLVIGNMNRFVDVYAATGEQLAQLGGDAITAVPAVAVFHPTRDWIAAGTASGKLCLWM